MSNMPEKKDSTLPDAREESLQEAVEAADE